MVSLRVGSSCASTSGKFVIWLSRVDRRESRLFLLLPLDPLLEIEKRLFVIGFGVKLNSKEESEGEEMGMKAEFRRDSNGVWF